MNNYLKTCFIVLILIASIISGCQDTTWLDESGNNTKKYSPSTASIVASELLYANRAIDWSDRLNDSYSLDEAVTDFGNIQYGWQESRAFNSAGTFRIKLLKNALGANCGIISKIDIASGSEYELQFDVKFHSAFDWSRGGKIGFGFSIGDGFSGCNPAWSGDGGTFRLMWYQNNDGRIYFQPYAYYKDQPENCGDTFNKTFPETGSLVRGHWYAVKLYAKSNTGTNTDGKIKLTIDGVVVLNQSIRWTTNDSKRLINALYLSTFRGGSQAYWQSDTDGYIYFDNLSWKKLSD
jgi:hypothetical protein